MSALPPVAKKGNDPTKTRELSSMAVHGITRHFIHAQLFRSCLSGKHSLGSVSSSLWFPGRLWGWGRVLDRTRCKPDNEVFDTQTLVIAVADKGFSLSCIQSIQNFRKKGHMLRMQQFPVSINGSFYCFIMWLRE